MENRKELFEKFEEWMEMYKKLTVYEMIVFLGGKEEDLEEYKHNKAGLMLVAFKFVIDQTAKENNGEFDIELARKIWAEVKENVVGEIDDFDYEFVYNAFADMSEDIVKTLLEEDGLMEEETGECCGGCEGCGGGCSCKDE